MRWPSPAALFLLAVVAYGLAWPRPAAAGSYTLTTLASFDGANGAGPLASPTLDPQGNLYGTASAGGANNLGTVFELAAGSRSITTLASFDGADGSQPEGSVMRDAQCNLYGTASAGGANNLGTVFELAAGSHSITTLATFNGANGGSPPAGPVRDEQGNLYGTTHTGGPGGQGGTVFELVAGSSSITTLATFNGTNGGQPTAGVVRDAQGNLFGTTPGFFGASTVFELAAGSHTLTTLATFSGTQGVFPSGVILDSHGNLFGTTAEGGAHNLGTVFELAAGSSTITTLASFDGTNGSFPIGGLVQDAQGNLFGTTGGGGANGLGTVFELSPVPEPASLVLLGLGLMGVAALARRIRAQQDGGGKSN